MHSAWLLPAIHTSHCVLLARCYDTSHVRHIQAQRELGTAHGAQDQLLLLQVQSVRVGSAISVHSRRCGIATTSEIRQPAGRDHSHKDQLLVSMYSTTLLNFDCCIHRTKLMAMDSVICKPDLMQMLNSVMTINLMACTT